MFSQDIEEQIDNGGLQWQQPNGEMWLLYRCEDGYVLIRQDGGYEQYSEQHESRSSAMQSAAAVAPLAAWTNAEW